MVAKTQFKVDQFVAKRQLRRLLKARSLYRREDEAEFSQDDKEARAELDMKIKWVREFMETNKLTVTQKKRTNKRETIAA